jgi:hypothetical protein
MWGLYSFKVDKNIKEKDKNKVKVLFDLIFFKDLTELEQIK